MPYTQIRLFFVLKNILKKILKKICFNKIFFLILQRNQKTKTSKHLRK
jgi:hypothetical protein